jgi:homoserine dehydrogenase
VAFHTRYYPDEPLVVQGRGAGVDAAAAGVHSDLVAIAHLGFSGSQGAVDRTEGKRLR